MIRALDPLGTDEVDRVNRHRALLDVIGHFKPAGMSDLTACLNTIENHAETIRKQHERIEELERFIRSLYQMASAIGVEPPEEKQCHAS